MRVTMWGCYGVLLTVSQGSPIYRGREKLRGESEGGNNRGFGRSQMGETKLGRESDGGQGSVQRIA